jgi:hypothetical protein
VFKGPAGGGGGGDDVDAPVLAAATDLRIQTKSPPKDDQPWTFTATQADVNATSVRVQSSRTASGPWEDLPHGAQMKGKASRVFTAKSLNVTNATGTGDLYFRIVSSAPGFKDGVSAPAGPFPVRGSTPQVGGFSRKCPPGRAGSPPRRATRSRTRSEPEPTAGRSRT